MHLTLEFNERTEGGYHVCNTCGTKTALISACANWSVDSEPFKADEETESELGDNVDVSEELTAHFCPTCYEITSLSFNS